MGMCSETEHVQVHILQKTTLAALISEENML